ncbi:YihY/virulence factor BrkB family protein [Cellulomonas marina]|uniref:Membrane protein n=1 Tax=Cellulomonas marina TaxID=988821 RepID=A0A1I0YHV0_9CELL|nr:YihY/virulence factor BrkB family protein [Cellulomonas marina]GIG28732.1 ribonuclease [Cellulomonas marina]SFB11743.1 membrane protein [Cellulomonas marina]
MSTSPTVHEDADQQAQGPDPEDPRKPDSPDDLTKPSWKYVLRKTVREFTDDQCTDLAAALTYYAVLALAPALLALVSVLSLVGDGAQLVEQAVGVVEQVAPDAGETIGPILTAFTQTPAAGFALVIGLATALWSASGYVGAFGRAMNRVYEVEEGRPFWKLRPTNILVTFVTVVIVAVVIAALVLSGGVARSIGDLVGLSDVTVTVWNIAKWPVIVALVVLAVAVLYNFTPNVKQPKFRWTSLGAALAIVTWALATVAFGFYVANFGSYNETYGTFGGVIAFLLWLWITNLALLFGAELDAEIERGRELQGGIAAEIALQLPARDVRSLKKKQAKREEDEAMGRALRMSHGEHDAKDEVKGRS